MLKNHGLVKSAPDRVDHNRVGWKRYVLPMPSCLVYAFTDGEMGSINDRVGQNVEKLKSINDFSDGI